MSLNECIEEMMRLAVNAPHMTDEKFMLMAAQESTQATCLRRKFGAILVDKNGFVVGTGRNETVLSPNMQSCVERGRCWRQDNNIPSGSNYEKCYSVHAEQMALLQAGQKAKGGTMYIFGWDIEKNAIYKGTGGCLLCTKMMLAAGVNETVEYALTDNGKILRVADRPQDSFRHIPLLHAYGWRLDQGGMPRPDFNEPKFEEGNEY